MKFELRVFFQKSRIDFFAAHDEHATVAERVQTLRKRDPGRKVPAGASAGNDKCFSHEIFSLSEIFSSENSAGTGDGGNTVFRQLRIELMMSPTNENITTRLLPP